MKTLNELLDLANQGKLDEIDTLAGLAQGWELNKGETVWLQKGIWQEKADDYHPTRDKGQAFELAIKAKMLVAIGNHTTEVVYDPATLCVDVECKDPLIAVTIAFILAMQGEE